MTAIQPPNIRANALVGLFKPLVSWRDFIARIIIKYHDIGYWITIRLRHFTFSDSYSVTSIPFICYMADSRFAPSQWETLLCNDVSHWLGASLESALYVLHRARYRSNLGIHTLRRHGLIGIGIPVINLRQWSDRLRFIMWIPMPVRRRLWGNRGTGCLHLRGLLVVCKGTQLIYTRWW